MKYYFSSFYLAFLLNFFTLLEKRTEYFFIYVFLEMSVSPYYILYYYLLLKQKRRKPNFFSTILLVVVAELLKYLQDSVIKSLTEPLSLI